MSSLPSEPATLPLPTAEATHPVSDSSALCPSSSTLLTSLQHPSTLQPSKSIFPNDYAPQSIESTVITLFAAWTGFARYSRHQMGAKKTHVYTLVYRPSTPLYEGAQIRIMAITLSAFHSLSASVSAIETYNPHVIGSITMIAHGQPGRVEITVVNECRRNTVEIVQINAPNHPDIVRWTHFPFHDFDNPKSHNNPAPCTLLSPGDDLVESRDNAECGGSDCIESSHEVADARIGPSLVEFSDDDEVENHTSSKRSRRGTVAGGDRRRKPRKMETQPGMGAPFSIPRSQKRGKMAAAGWVDRDMIQKYITK